MVSRSSSAKANAARHASGEAVNRNRSWCPPSFAGGKKVFQRSLAQFDQLLVVNSHTPVGSNDFQDDQRARCCLPQIVQFLF